MWKCRDKKSIISIKWVHLKIFYKRIVSDPCITYTRVDHKFEKNLTHSTDLV